MLSRLYSRHAYPNGYEIASVRNHPRKFQVHTIPALIQWALILFIFTIPLESVDIGVTRGSLSLARIAGLLFFGCCLLYPKKSFSFPPLPLWLFAGYSAFYLVNGLFIRDIFLRMFMTRFITIAQLLVFSWAVSTLMREARLARKVLLAYSLSTVFLFLGMRFGLPGFSTETLTSSTDTRVTTTDFNPNYLALILALSAIILLGLRLDKNTKSFWAKSLLFIGLLIVLGFMVQTGSRAGICAFMVGVSFYLLPLGRTRRRMVAVGLAIAALIIVAILIVRNPDALGRWSKTVTEGDSMRERIYTGAIELVREKPFFGYGPFESLSMLNYKVRNSDGIQDPHDLPLFLLLEVGLIGGFPFFLGIGVCAFYAWTARNGPLGLLPLSLLATMLVGLLFHTWMTNKPLWMVLATCCASGFIRGSEDQLAQSRVNRPVRR